MYGWVIAKNINISCLGEYLDMDGYLQYNKLLNKFPQDQVFMDGGDKVCFLDGYVHNKEYFVNNTASEWQKAFYDAVGSDLKQTLAKMRGGFCGYVYDNIC